MGAPSSEDTTDPRPTPVDRGWAWVVCTSAFLLQLLTLGIMFTFGIIYEDLLVYFKEKRGTTAWIGSIQPALIYATGLVAPSLLKKFGWRLVTIGGAVISTVGFGVSAITPNIYLLYFSYGCLTGIGYGMMYVTSMVVVQHYFDKKRALATGLAVSGGGVGTLLFGLLAPILLQNIEWRWTLVVYAAVSLLVGIPCGMLLKPLPEVTEAQEEPPNNNSDLKEEKASLLKNNKGAVGYESFPQQNGSAVTIQPEDSPGCGGFLNLLSQPSFALFCFAVVMFSFGYNAPYVYTPDRATQFLGISKDKAASLISIIGVANVASRLLFGWMGDKNEMIRQYMLAIVLTLGGLVSVFIFLFNAYITLIVYSILFGMFAGCFVSLFPVVAVDLVGKHNVSKSVGLAFTMGSIGALFSSPLSGWIIDLTGSFNFPFYVVGAAQAIGGLVFFVNVIYRYTFCCRRSAPRYTFISQEQMAKKSNSSSGIFSSETAY